MVGAFRDPHSMWIRVSQIEQKPHALGVESLGDGQPKDRAHPDFKQQKKHNEWIEII